MTVDGLTITTSGSVGLDETLDLTAELQLPKNWLGSGTIGQLLGGKPLRIPITGTFTRPRVDPSIMQNLGGQAAGNAANNLIQKQLDRGLNKLFDKIK